VRQEGGLGQGCDAGPGSRRRAGRRSKRSGGAFAPPSSPDMGADKLHIPKYGARKRQGKRKMQRKWGKERAHQCLSGMKEKILMGPTTWSLPPRSHRSSNKAPTTKPLSGRSHYRPSCTFSVGPEGRPSEARSDPPELLASKPYEELLQLDSKSWQRLFDVHLHTPNISCPSRVKLQGHDSRSDSLSNNQ
jgi:hypothetical protein